MKRQYSTERSKQYMAKKTNKQNKKAKITKKQIFWVLVLIAGATLVSLMTILVMWKSLL